MLPGKNNLVTEDLGSIAEEGEMELPRMSGNHGHLFQSTIIDTKSRTFSINTDDIPELPSDEDEIPEVEKPLESKAKNLLMMEVN